MKEFGERLKKVREGQELSQKDLKARASIKGNQLSDYETGKVIPSETNLLAIIEALKLPIDYFDDTLPYVREIKGQEILQNVQKFIELKPNNNQSKALLEVVKAFTEKLKVKEQ